MITIYQYLPGWTVPCISPYVTKVLYYMRMVGLPFESKLQDLTKLDHETPHGKLPVIVDDDGTRVAELDADHRVPQDEVRQPARRQRRTGRAGPDACVEPHDR